MDTQLNHSEPHEAYAKAVSSHPLFSILPLSLKKQTKGVKLGSLSLHSLLYADDLAILADNITVMQRNYENLFDWCTTWGIQINANKSAIIHFQPKTHQALYPKMQVRDQTLDFVSEYKYLGVSLVPRLSPHANEKWKRKGRAW